MSGQYAPMTVGTEEKNALLKQFSTAPEAMRKKIMRLVEQQGFVDTSELTKERDEAFFGCCIADLRARGEQDEHIRDFAARLAKLPNDQLDFLVVVCTEVDKEQIKYLPGFTRHIARLFGASSAASVQ